MSTYQKCSWLLVFLFSLAACKKDKENRVASFELIYNGTTHNLTPDQWSFFSNSLSIAGNGTPFDLFEMQKSEDGRYCAAVIKSDCCDFNFIGFNYDSVKCVADVIDQQQQKLDSSKVYEYMTGNMNYETSNCRNESGVGLGGNPVTVTYCDLSGSFILVASNGTGEQINASGTFHLYDVQR